MKLVKFFLIMNSLFEGELHEAKPMKIWCVLHSKHVVFVLMFDIFYHPNKTISCLKLMS